MNGDHKKTSADSKEYGEAFAAIGSTPRIEVLFTVVKAADRGLTIGEIQEITQIPASTLAHHLRFLADAKLIIQERDGRRIINKANLGTIEKLSAFLIDILALKNEDK